MAAVVIDWLVDCDFKRKIILSFMHKQYKSDDNNNNGSTDDK